MRLDVVFFIFLLLLFPLFIVVVVVVALHHSTYSAPHLRRHVQSERQCSHPTSRNYWLRRRGGGPNALFNYYSWFLQIKQLYKIPDWIGKTHHRRKKCTGANYKLINGIIAVDALLLLLLLMMGDGEWRTTTKIMQLKPPRIYRFFWNFIKYRIRAYYR